MRRQNRITSGTLVVVYGILFLSGCSNSGPITISGNAVDSKTGKPAANARAIVTVMNEGFKSLERERHGIQADEEGRLNAVIKPGIEYNYLRIEACGTLGSYSGADWPKSGFTIRLGEVPSKYMKMYSKNKDKEWMTYGRFSGGRPISRYENITFHGLDWDAYKIPPISP